MRLCKQIIAVLMIGIMMLSMTGCGKGSEQGDGGNKSKNEMSEEHKTMVYKSSDIVMDGAQGDIEAFVVKGDKIYFRTAEWREGEAEESGEAKEIRIDRMYVSNMDGSNVREIPMQQIGDERWIYSMSVNDSGEIILGMDSYDQKTKASAYYIVKLNENGEELSKEDITKPLKLNDENNINKIFFDNQERLIVVSDRLVKVLDSDYKTVTEIKSENYLSVAAVTADGQIICGMETMEGIQVQVLDVENGKWGEAFPLDIPYFSHWDSLMNGNEDYDFYYSDENGVYGFTIAENKGIKLMDYVASNIPTDRTFGMASLNKDLMIGRIQNEDVNTRLIQYTKVDPSEVSDKTTIIFW